MSLLHDYFNTRNLQLFQRLLQNTALDKTQSTAPGTSGGKSWKKHGFLHAGPVDVNGKDWLGRTVLHLASASIERLDYVQALLNHPAINVNLPDTESHWTPLHRAMYSANIPAALLLLQHPDVDTTLKDNEGYTAFDVYNSTLVGTKPAPEEAHAYADLYTWGTNVNAALGLGDSNDRVYPEHVTLLSKDNVEDVEYQSLSARFAPVRVKHVAMSKLHTAVVTSESGGNLRVCGFGSGGRLGSNSYTQYILKPLLQVTQTIVSVALGQDHTLALTTTGEVLSWGLNRFSQLGYIVDPPTSGRAEEPIQYTPRKVQGSLRKEVVNGIAASKCASACWTDEAVYTWGTNNGQLGYDKAAQPVQVLPRKVSRLTMPVVSIAMTENAMACLLQNRQVECFYDNGHHRINFPTQAFPSPIRPYRPPQATKDFEMAKITSCGDTFASLSYHGEVYIFSPTNASNTPSPSTANTMTSSSVQDSEGTMRSGGPFKCQRVWALRKKSSAVKDVALGVDGSIIICTESGHVFVRARNVALTSASLYTSTSSGTAPQKTFKFQRVPFLQRVVRVCANSSGAFGALRVEVSLKSVEVKGQLVGQDLSRVAPWLGVGQGDEEEDVFGWKKTNGMNNHTTPRPRSQSQPHIQGIGAGVDSDNEDMGGEEEDVIEDDIRGLKEICDAVKREERLRKDGVKIEELVLPHGGDAVVVLQSGATFPVHKVILAARSEALRTILSSQPKQSEGRAKDEKGNIEIKLLPPITRHPAPNQPQAGPGAKSLIQLSIRNADPLAVLIVLNYLYSDNVITVWDRRISIPVAQHALKLKLKWDVTRIRNDIAGLARALKLVDLSVALERPVKIMPLVHNQRLGIVKDLNNLFDAVNPSSSKDREGEDGEEGVEREVIDKAEVEGAPGLSKAFKHDVVFELEDREVFTHSVVLRARSDLFKAFFDEPDWTKQRWDDDIIRVNLRHLNWRVMKFVLRFMCCGCDKELFEVLEFVKNADDLVEFMFEVMAAADELLLDRLVLLCSEIILTHSDFHNACYVLGEATYYSATQLIDRIQSYITANLELFLESHILDDMPRELLAQLARFIQQKQWEKAPYVRGGQLIDETMAKWLDWVETQDIPVPFVRSNKPLQVKKNGLPIPKFEKPSRDIGTKVLRNQPSVDDIFIMDNTESSGPAWKIRVVPKVDMKTVMAEAALDNNKPDQSPRPLSKLQGVPLPTMSSPQIGKGSPQVPGSPWKTPVLPQQRLGEETSKVQPAAHPSSSHSTPQKQKDTFKPPVIMGRSPSSGGQLSNMGPTITPTRMQASLKGGVGQRSVSGSSKAWAYAWSLDTITPSVPAEQNTSRVTAKATAGPSSPTQASSSTTDRTSNETSNSKSMSFLAIQDSQEKEQLSLFSPKKDKRSLVEIQEEERARREEEDFLRWWQEEEARVKMEMEALEKSRQTSLSGGAGGKPKKGGRGRQGRGGGGRGEGNTAQAVDRGEKCGDPGRGGSRGGRRREGKGLENQGTLAFGSPSQPTNPISSNATTQNSPRPQYRRSKKISERQQP